MTPFKTGRYFNKIQCFCFTEQVLRPGETARMPLTFFVDPEMAGDSGAGDVHTITLGYTFFKSRDQAAARQLERAMNGAEHDHPDGTRHSHSR